MDREAEQQRETEVGDLLRTQRLQAGLTISEASKILCIREAYLNAIEDGRFADLPGPTYVAGFIRTYSEHLGLNGNEVVRQLRAEPLSMDSSSELRFPSPLSEGGMPTGAILLLGVLVALVAYGAWYVMNTRDDSVAELISPLPERLVAFLRDGNGGPEGEEAVQSRSTAGTSQLHPSDPDLKPFTNEVTPSAALSGRTQTDTPRSQLSDAATPLPKAVIEEQHASAPRIGAESGTTVDNPPLKSEDAATTADTGNPETMSRLQTNADDEMADAQEQQPRQTDLDSGQPTTAGAASASGVQIVLQAKSESWIEIRENSTNRIVFAKLLKPGDTFEVPKNPDLKLLTGNAGGLEILVDGERVPQLGAEGTVRRNVPLDAAQLRSGTLARN